MTRDTKGRFARPGETELQAQGRRIRDQCRAGMVHLAALVWHGDHAGPEWGWPVRGPEWRP